MDTWQYQRRHNTHQQLTSKIEKHMDVLVDGIDQMKQSRLLSSKQSVGTINNSKVIVLHILTNIFPTTGSF